MAHIERRTLIRGAAWSIPVVAAAVTVPGAAATGGCDFTPVTRTLSSSGQNGASEDWRVPECATIATFNLYGGSGGQRGYNGGNGGHVSGSFPVTPGEVLWVIAGGQGGVESPGRSIYGDGGRGRWGGGGGGAASAIWYAGSLIAVAAGGGGGSNPVYQGSTDAVVWRGNSDRGNAWQQGVTRYLAPDRNSSGTYSTVRGGGAGSLTAAGKGGTYSGYADVAHNGFDGNGTRGGDGATAAREIPSAGIAGGGGGGGGGYRGGGGGASLWWTYQGAGHTLPSGGGGGSSYVSPIVSDARSEATSWSGGSIMVTFS